jgi:hypothetical protein
MSRHTHEEVASNGNAVNETLSRRGVRILAPIAAVAVILGMLMAVPATADAATSYGPYQTTASPSLNERSAPSTSSSVTGTLPDGSTIYIACQTTGTSVDGSAIWDQLANGSYVSDYWTTTPNFGTWSPPIPQCRPPLPPTYGPYKTTASPTLNERIGPLTSSEVTGSLPDNSTIYIACQTMGSSVDGSKIWDQLANGSYVSDYWTTTPNVGTWSPPIPQCSPPTSNDPRLAEALAWEQAHLGSAQYNELCELSVENAYGTSGRYATAAADYQAQLAAGTIHSGTAPAGALVFFKGNSSAGHVGIADGGSNYYTSDGTIHVAPYTEGGGYLGWSYAPASWPGA